MRGCRGWQCQCHICVVTKQRLSVISNIFFTNSGRLLLLNAPTIVYGHVTMCDSTEIIDKQCDIKTIYVHCQKVYNLLVRVWESVKKTKHCRSFLSCFAAIANRFCMFTHILCSSCNDKKPKKKQKKTTEWWIAMCYYKTLCGR